eukprot:1118097-Pleurochrysis_carterae.AAC.1
MHQAMRRERLPTLSSPFFVGENARESAPLITADNNSPLTPSQADNLLASLLRDYLAPEEAA